MVTRYYFAITNKCNRMCPLCSCYSDSSKTTFLDLRTYESILPKQGLFEVQFEGGEPLLHPDLAEMIKIAKNTGRCVGIRLSTNGVLLPYIYQKKSGLLDPKETIKSLCRYFLSYPSPFLLKMSINHHLIERDPLHLKKAELVRDAFERIKRQGEYSILFNVRRRKRPLAEDDDRWLVEEIRRRGLEKYSNIFFYQRYGKAKDREELELPFIVPDPIPFFLINPDGSIHGTDLIERAEAMGKLR